MNTGGVANTYEVTQAMEAHGLHMERGLWDEMARLAEEAVRRMQAKAPKHRSTLWTSINKSQPEPNVWEIGPTVGYALYREMGQKPGKHLPEFGTQKARDITEWLRSKAFAGLRRVSRKSKAFDLRELELRDRYMGLSWHAKHKGFKAQPFVRPTHEEMAQLVPQRMAAAAKRLLDQPQRISVLLNQATRRMQAGGQP